MKKISARLLTKNVTHQVGKDTMDIVKLDHKKRYNNAKEKVEKERSTCAKRIVDAYTVITTKGELCDAWKFSDLKHI